MPGGMDGVALVQALRRRGIPLPVILVSGHGDIALAVRGMKAGAVDFIEKPYEDTTILGAVAEVLAGLAIATDAEAARQVEQLSLREREVLMALVAGKANKTIAHELGISPRTVEVHRARHGEARRPQPLGGGADRAAGGARRLERIAFGWNRLNA